MTKTNPWEELGRLKKAQKMADLAMRSGIGSEFLERMVDVQWTRFAEMAKVNPGSEETRKLVISLVKEREK